MTWLKSKLRAWLFPELGTMDRRYMLVLEAGGLVEDRLDVIETYLETASPTGPDFKRHVEPPTG